MQLVYIHYIEIFYLGRTVTKTNGFRVGAVSHTTRLAS